MDCGLLTSKTVLIVLSLVFWVAAGALGYVGSYVFTTYKIYDHFLEDKYTLVPAVVIIAVAVVLFIIGFIGCCATLRESRFGLGFFLVVLLVIFAVEVAAFVLGVLYRDRVRTDVEKSINHVFQQYDGKNAESRAVDYLQKQLHCCGIQNYTDWMNTQWFKNSTENDSVPVSCCKHGLTNCTGNLQQPQFLYTHGCKHELEVGLQKILSYAMLVILGFAIIKFFGMLSVCVVMCREKQRNGYQNLNGATFA
ncbi:tetraspanin 36 [Latimeria chalumnae]|uniref:Tetraspanin n=1 Tax=Latimeria chalumnae TaxID=7897 RepID=H3A4G8_LATCH|nr:PREDICTED: tetraspanin-3-like [Latimeria chalumnae]|eukprot:XP_006012998.1 PREDICTED: tetraspanin-3-like [Latimeria chalumnae]